MQTKEITNPNSLPKKKHHRWKNFQANDKLAVEFEQKVLAFEDASIKVRMLLAKKYGVIYHCPYFTKNVPDATIKGKEKNGRKKSRSGAT